MDFTVCGRRDRMVQCTCAIGAYHHLSCEFAPRSWRGVLDTTLCDKVYHRLLGYRLVKTT
jgi:hypothetical protein